jgi:hypothetical protein
LRNLQNLNTNEPILEQRYAYDLINQTQRQRSRMLRWRSRNASHSRTAIDQGGEHPTDDTFDFCRVSVNDFGFQLSVVLRFCCYLKP